MFPSSHVPLRRLGQRIEHRRHRTRASACIGACVLAVIATAAAAVVAWVPFWMAPAPEHRRAAMCATAGGVATPEVAGGDCAEPLPFRTREVGSAELVMLSRMPAGHMITTHCFAAIIEGTVDPDRLQQALEWATVRHAMLRATAKEPDVEKTEDFGPVVHAGKDGRWMWLPSNLSVSELARRALCVKEVVESFDEMLQRDFEDALDKSTFDFESGPLWGVTLYRESGGRSALLFKMVHAIDDQKSGNILLHDIMTHMEASERGKPLPDPTPLVAPKSLEDIFLVDELDPQRLATYALSQAEAGAKPHVMLPSAFRSEERGLRKIWALDPKQPVAKDRPLVVPTEPAEGDDKYKAIVPERISEDSVFSSENRQNLVSFRRLPAKSVTALRQLGRDNNVTMSMVVATAALLAASDVGHDDKDFGYEAYRLLLGVDMRRFGPDGDWTNGSMAFASGALDFSMRLLPKSGAAFAAEHGEDARSLPSQIGGVPFWDLARACDIAVKRWVENGYVAESTRLFDLGVRFLRMDEIIRATANDPSTLGRAYSVTVSNAGVYNIGPSEGQYGSLQLSGMFFGISSAVSGSMVAASCLTVNGDLMLTAHGSTPIVNRTELNAFADSIIRTLTVAAEAPLPRSIGVPVVDNPIDPRAGTPWWYPLETPKGTLRCPKYEEIKSPALPPFNVDKYIGIWYELAFHDITQFNGCGCTRFNMTRTGNIIEDMFTVSCPWPWREGIEGPWLPGYNSKTGFRRLNSYTCNMTMYYQPERPGVMTETGFGQSFDNMVLEIWNDPDITAETGYEYTRAIQFQCLGKESTGITFTGINFLSRVPVVTPARLQEMFVRARSLGLEPYGSNDMHVVEHAGCRYPKSTDRSYMGERPVWPFPIFEGDLGALI